MSRSFPWSFYSTLVTFAIFFGPLNIYIVTILISHPWANPIWLIISLFGLVGLLYSIRMVRIHQQEMINAKALEDAQASSNE